MNLFLLPVILIAPVRRIGQRWRATWAPTQVAVRMGRVEHYPALAFPANLVAQKAINSTMAASGICGRDRLKPVAVEIVAKTLEIIPTAQQHNEKSAEAALRHLVGVDLLKENDELRDRVAELDAKVYKLEMELAVAKGKSWWQRLWGD